MLKTLVQYLLFLCIILLCGYSQRYLHTDQAFTPNPSLNNHERAEDASIDALHNAPACIFNVSSSETENSFNLKATEIEENKQNLYKKYLESSNYFTALVYILALLFFFRHFKTSLRFCKHFSYTSSKRRFLVFQVFRI